MNPNLDIERGPHIVASQDPWGFSKICPDFPFRWGKHLSPIPEFMPTSPATTAGTDSNETNEMDADSADMETFPEPVETLEGDQATLKMVSWRKFDFRLNMAKLAKPMKKWWGNSSNFLEATWRNKLDESFFAFQSWPGEFANHPRDPWDCLDYADQIWGNDP